MAPPTDTPPARGAKPLGLLAVFAISAGAMISSGLFVLPGLAFAEAGPAVLVCYALALVLVVPVMFAKAELGTAMPRSGGSYFFIERGLGTLPGTVAGMAYWLSVSLKTSFALIGLGALGALLLPRLFPDVGAGTVDLAVKVVACAAGGLFTLLNLVSTKGSGRLQVLMVVGLLAILFGYVGLTAPEVQVERVIGDFNPGGWSAIFAVTGLVFVSFGGLTKVVAVAGEVARPTRNLPLGMFLAAAVVGFLYLTAVFVTIGAVEGEELAGSMTPLALGAAKVGSWLAWAVEAAAFLAFATTANAGILSASRAPMAMSQDGLLPAFLSRQSRFGTPHHAVLVTGGFCVLSIVVLSVEDLVKMASATVLLMFILQNLSLAALRLSGLQNYRPTYRSPWAPWVQIAATVVYVLLLAQIGLKALLLTGGACLLAALWYVAYVRPRVDRQSALVYLVQRLVAPDIGRPELELELKHLAIARDRVPLDRFDRLVAQAEVLDLDGPLELRALLGRVAEVLGRRLGRPAEPIEQELVAREARSSTVVRPGVAIPHLVLEGEELFELVMVRCKEGARFSDLHAPNVVIFVLASSADQRNFHLRCLMHIAATVEEPGFRERWLAAQGATGLRDLMHLSGRRRDVPPEESGT